MTWRRPAAALLLPVLAAAALGIWGIGFGLPFAFRPDEEVFVGRAVRMVLGSSLDPQFYVYPPLGLYAMAAAEWMLGLFAPASLGAATAVDPSAEYLAARLVSVAAFAAAAGLVGLAGRRLYGAAAGLLGAVAFAVGPLAVQNAHFGRVDMLGAAFVALAIWLGARAGSRGGWALAGIAAGLAAGTKYTFGTIAIYIAVLLMLQPGDRPRRLLAGAGGALAAFLVALAPAGHPAQLLDGIRFLGGRALGDYPGLPIGLIYHPTVSLPAGLGWGAYLLVLGGLALALWRRRPADLALAAFIGAYYLLIGFSHEVFFRYLLPVLPALCLLAGGLLREEGPLSARWSLVAGLAALLLLPSAIASVEDDHLLTATDTRVLAARWLEANAVPGSALVISSYWSEPFYDRAAVGSEPLHPLYLAGDPVADSFQLGLYSDRFVINGAGSGSACYRYSASGPPWQTPSPATAGTALATFSPSYPGDLPSGVYDPLDAFYLPLLAFTMPERPGPSIVITTC